MRTIYKYPIKIIDTQTIKIDSDSRPKPLHVGRDPQGALCLWAELEPVDPKEWVPQTWEIVVSIFGTGHPMPSLMASDHLGSFVEGHFVWHVYTYTR